MKYNLSTPEEVEQVKQYLQKLIEKEAKIELKEVRPQRSLNQNNYLYLILSMYAIETGYNVEEIKLLLKNDMAYLMTYQKNGLTFPRSTASLDSKEMTDFIEFTRNHAGLNGIYLPDPEEYSQSRFEYEREVERQKFTS